MRYTPRGYRIGKDLPCVVSSREALTRQPPPFIPQAARRVLLAEIAKRQYAKTEENKPCQLGFGSAHLQVSRL